MEWDRTAVGQFLLFLTTVLGFGIQLYREKRNREWDLADRELARKQLAAKVEIAHESVMKKIEENTEISREAFTEANNVNAKLLKLAQQIDGSFDRRADDMRRRSSDLLKETAKKVEETKTVVDETFAKVEHIEKKLP